LKPAFVFLITLNLIGAQLFAGPKARLQEDSLKKLLAPTLRDPPQKASKVDIDRINKLADSYFESYPDSALFYGTMAVNLAKKIDYQKGTADGLMQQATVYTFKGDYKIASVTFNSALAIYKQLNNNYGISEAYLGLGRVEDFLGNYAAAIKLFNKALDLRIKSNNQMDLADCYAIMGITYDNKGEYSKALDYDFKSLVIDLARKNDLAAADNYCNIGVVMQELELYDKAYIYFNNALVIWRRDNDRQGISTAYQNIGEILLAQKKYRQAIGYLNKASAIFNVIGDQEGVSLMYNDFGLYHYYTDHPDSAIYYFNLSLKSAVKNKIRNNKAHAYLGLAMAYNRQKDYHSALDNATQAQNIANAIGSINIKADAALQLSAALGGLAQFKDAYVAHLRYTTLTDSLKKDANIQKLIASNREIDFQNALSAGRDRQHQLDAYYAEQNAFSRRTIIAFGIFSLFMSVMVGVYYNAKRKQQQINVLLTAKNVEVLSQKTDLNIQADKLNELNILKDRLIGVLAHDLRAPLSTLHGLFALMTEKDINYQEFIEMAPSVFSKLESTSDFLDTLLFWINSQVDNVAQTAKSFCLCDLVELELKMLDGQLAQKSLNVKNNVRQGDIVLADPSSIRIVIHNLLTNAIKFSRKGTTIHMATYSTDDGYRVFSIKDEGMGMAETQLSSLFKSKVNSTLGTDNEIGTGMGLLFCKDLVEKYGGKIWAKSAKGEGTELFFMLPAGSDVVDKVLFIQ